MAAWLVLGAMDALPTVAFLVGVPATMSALPILMIDDDQADLYVRTFLWPWLSVMTFLVALAVVFGERGICLILTALPVLGTALLSSLVLWILRANDLRASKKAKATLLAMALPFAMAALEKTYFMPERECTTSSTVLIQAPPEAVFDRLASVETIRDSEYQTGIFNQLGVPRPIRATVDRAGRGGHRIGEFENGLTFQEVITAYEPPRRMAFSVDVRPESLRRGSPERHAFETGYFRFVDAAYELVPSGGGVWLTLRSRYIVRTDCNAYASWWAQLVIGDFQLRVLGVLKNRIEGPLPFGDHIVGVPKRISETHSQARR